jgi:DMSO reductase family type II enzyme heme b subunit
VNAVSFQVLMGEEAMALRLSWDDPSKDSADALALLLKPEAAHGDAVTLQAWPYQGAPQLDVCYWSAGRTESFEMLAATFEEVTERRGRSVALTAAAAYEEGRWRLVLQRPLAPTSLAGAAAIDLEEFGSIAFALWDGSHPGARAVSPWVDVAWRAPKSHTE